MKKILILLLSVLMIFTFAACGSEPEEPATTEVEMLETFEEAHCLTAEMTNRNDDSDDIYATFVIKNEGKYTINDCSLDFSCYDADGNELNTGYDYLNYALEPGKTAVIDLNIYFDSGDPAAVDSVELVAYEYYINNVAYEVDLKAETMDPWDWGNENAVDFDAANILSFEIVEEGAGSWDFYDVVLQITNNSDAKVNEAYFDIAYLDENMNFLDESSGYTESVIEPGKFVTSDTSSWNEDVTELIKSVAVYEYTYDLVEPDANGYNHYEVDLQSKTAYGYLYE